MQVINDPVVDCDGQLVDVLSYEAYALSQMRGRPGKLQYCGYCLGPPDANPQQGFLIME